MLQSKSGCDEHRSDGDVPFACFLCRKNFGQSRFGATKNGGSEKKIEEPDDDYWGFVEEEKEVEEASPRRSSH